MNEHTITVNTYHEYMETAFAALRHGLSDLDDAKSREEDDHVTSWLTIILKPIVRKERIISNTLSQ